MEAKIDISSATVEKGLDVAKEFLQKLIGPSLEEAGLLLKKVLHCGDLKTKSIFWRRQTRYVSQRY